MADDLTPKEFARQLRFAAMRTPTEIEKVVRRNAYAVRRQARRNVRQTAPVHDANAAETITHDTQAEGVDLIGEVGYDRSRGRQAAIGNLLEFGGGRDYSPPHRDLARALEVQEEPFVQALAEMGEAIIADTIARTRARMSGPEVDE